MDAFWQWWQQLPLNIDPVVFEIGWFRLQYYGLMYLVAFLTCYGLVRHRIRTEKAFSLSMDSVNELTVNMILGVVIGGRLGYVVFYNPGYYLQHPLEIILPFEFSQGVRFTGISGMSFHGGLLGVIIASWLTARKRRMDFWQIGDLFAPAAPLGYTFGRIGNFINGELFGRATDSPLGMHFPAAPGTARRHPSQLYEAFFEGVFLFIILWSLRKKTLPRGAMVAFYLVGYGTVRFFIEFYRQPDPHLGAVVGIFSMGQLLCAAMIAAGLLLYAYLSRKHSTGKPPVARRRKKPQR